jgi:hypothetical protein
VVGNRRLYCQIATRDCIKKIPSNRRAPLTGIENDTQQTREPPPTQTRVSKTIPGSREYREFNENRENRKRAEQFFLLGSL